MHICFSGKLDNLFKQDNMMAAEVFLKTGDYKGCIYETSMWGSEMTNSLSLCLSRKVLISPFLNNEVQSYRILCLHIDFFCLPFYSVSYSSFLTKV